MPDSHLPYVGRPLKRTEDPRLIRGEGQYVDDLTLPGMAHLAFLRSPHPHARVLAIRTDSARRASGVLAVVTANWSSNSQSTIPASSADSRVVVEVRRRG